MGHFSDIIDKCRRLKGTLSVRFGSLRNETFLFSEYEYVITACDDFIYIHGELVSYQNYLKRPIPPAPLPCHHIVIIDLPKGVKILP